MAKPVHIAGTGSFAAEIAEWARDAGLEIAALIELEDPERVGSVIHTLPVIGLGSLPPGGRAILGRGGDRRRHWAQLAAAGWLPGGVIHPTAHLAATAEVAPSATVGPLAVIGAESTIGEQAIVSRGALVGHHVQIGDFASINPGVNIGGEAKIGAEAYLGMGSIIVNRTVVGAGATVAAGAVAVRDVDAEVRVQGIPAIPYAGR